MSETIIGIDLGTTNSEVAVVTGSQVTVLDTALDRKILPSFVGLADDGSILVGEAAKNQYVLYPERTIKSIKRRMGSNDRISLGDADYTPQEISAMILRRLKTIAEAYLGHDVGKAVITVPAYFSDAQRQATREAGEIAGLEVVRMINEPTAAALAYQSDRQDHSRILVYDLGGGTFDVSVVGIEQGVVEVLASHGNNHLGGDDFDAKLVDHIIAELDPSGNGDAVRQSRKALARITRAAEIAKIALSDQPFYAIEEEFLLSDNSGAPVNLSVEIARDDYETLIEPLIDETFEATHVALKGANLTVSDIDDVLLVGGASRTPLISRRFAEELGLHARAEADPELCVAAGAATQAAMLAGQSVSSVLVDITPYTFGTSALGELNGRISTDVFVPIVAKNTPIPVTKSDVFYTAVDDQTSVMVNVFQGEDRDARNNIKLGEFWVENLSKVPEGNPIVLRIALDSNGIMQVSALEKDTGLEKSITIDNALSRFQDGELDSARERLDALFADDDSTQDKDDGQNANTARAMASGGDVAAEASEQASALIKRAEQAMADASPDDRDDVINLVEALNDALKDRDAEMLSSATEELSDILYYLEQ